MLNFRLTNILLLASCFTMIALYVVYPFSFAYFLLAFLAWGTLVFYGCYNIDSDFFIPVHCSGDGSEKWMALSFDDGPSAEHTPAILDILKEEGVNATFFCIGRHIEGNEELMQRIHAEGHTIGNHSYSHHFFFDLFSRKRMMADLKLFDSKIYSLLNLTPRLFRPPYGVTNPQVRDVILQGNYFPVGWNIRSMDTVIPNRNRLMSRVVSRFSPGAIVLFHDSGKVTAQILREIILEAQQRGFVWVTVDHLLKVKPYV